MFTSSLLHGAKEEVAVAQEDPVRREPLRELLIKKSHQIPQLLSPFLGADGRRARHLGSTSELFGRSSSATFRLHPLPVVGGKLKNSA
jgi:hypothetical protein